MSGIFGCLFRVNPFEAKTICDLQLESKKGAAPFKFFQPGGTARGIAAQRNGNIDHTPPFTAQAQRQSAGDGFVIGMGRTDQRDRRVE